jgi:hypothetical protein
MRASVGWGSAACTSACGWMDGVAVVCCAAAVLEQCGVAGWSEQWVGSCDVDCAVLRCGGWLVWVVGSGRLPGLLWGKA